MLGFSRVFPANTPCSHCCITAVIGTHDTLIGAARHAGSDNKCSLSPHTHAVVLAVADVNGAVFVHEDAVRAGELAIARVAAIGAVSARSIADEDLNGAFLRVEVTDRM